MEEQKKKKKSHRIRFKFPLNVNILYFVKKECPFAADMTQKQVKEIVLAKNQELLDELLETGSCTLPYLGQLYIVRKKAHGVDKKATFIDRVKGQGYFNPKPVRYIGEYEYTVAWKRRVPGQTLKYNRYYRFHLNKNIKKLLKEKIFNGSIVYFDKNAIYDPDRVYKYTRNRRPTVR